MIHKIQNFIARGLQKLKKKLLIEKCDLFEIHIFSDSIKCNIGKPRDNIFTYDKFSYRILLEKC